MNLYYALWDEYFTYELHGTLVDCDHERRNALLEAESIDDAWTRAHKVAEANQHFGARTLLLTVVRVSRVQLPATVTIHHEGHQP